MTIHLIAAVSKNLVIGKNGSIPWNIPEDLHHFRTLTMGNVVIMGRKTYESLRKPLDHRFVIVVTSTPQAFPSGKDVMYSRLEDVGNILTLHPDKEVFVAGGSELYKHFLPQASHLHITRVDKIVQGDTKFPAFPNFELDQCVSKFYSDKEQCHVEFLEYVPCNKPSAEAAYLDLLHDVLENGSERLDRTGTGTISMFAKQVRFDISKHIPLLTTKFTAWKSCLQELLWFARGDTNAKHLQEQGVRIWDGNTTREFLDQRGLTDLPEGDIGAGYGFQWRHFGAEYNTCNDDYESQGIDQIEAVITSLREDPMGRRHIVSAWNPSALKRMALPPCHTMFQFYVEQKGSEKYLSCHMYQRSVDCFLGLPFNIFSYAVLTHIIAAKVGMKPKELVISTGDTHVYKDHIEQVRQQLTRTSLPLPTFQLHSDVVNKDWKDMSLDDFDVTGYFHHPVLKGKMSV